MKFSITVLFSILFFWVQAQTISGNVKDQDGEPLIGASVMAVGDNSVGTVTDFDGNFSLNIPSSINSIRISYVGYQAQTIDIAGMDNVNVILTSSLVLDEVVILGTRASNRTNVNSAVPVDVIDIDKLSGAAPQTSLNEIMHYSAPSFSSNTQTISDGTDHIDPASLRGLGPDQVLVLMNGKRRHNTSLVNINGTFGRGNVGTDLNAIPVSAINQIQVLRDGASAQYGSDAIAGVINIGLKETVNELSLSVNVGANMTSSDNIGAFGGETKDYDGEKVVVGLNYGLPLGNDGGFINMTGEFDYRGSTNRMLEWEGEIYNKMNTIERLAMDAGMDIGTLNETQVRSLSDAAGFTNGSETLAELQAVLSEDNTDSELAARGKERSDFNMRVGQSEVRGGKLFANMEIPLGESLALYGFGGMGYRSGESGCFYRLPNQSRTSTSIYIDGTVPLINSNITDKSIAGGIRGKVGTWDIDFSTVTGSNDFQFYITETHNATLGASSPTEFNAGGHKFSQTTSNLDLNQYFENAHGLAGINTAFGAEYRYENFNMNPGSEDSYGNYDVNGNLVNSATESEFYVTDFLGRSRPSGAQCFAGFLPFNAVDANRSSVAAYADFEFDITDRLMIGTAARFEDYSDFGSTFNYKVAGRFGITSNINLRAAHSTGFRAPSLHQIHFSRTSTIFSIVNGVSVPQEVGTFANTSRAAKLLGIPELKEETSNNYSVGVTASIPDLNLKITADLYQIDIDDRIVYTGSFEAGDDPELQQIFANAGADKAAFFANAINTSSQGFDLVISHSAILGEGFTLRNDLAATFSQTEAERDGDGNVLINASDLLIEKDLVGTYFNQEARIYLEEAVPRTKITLNNTFDFGDFNIYLRNTYFGEVTEATNEDLTDIANDGVYDGKIITDLSFGYRFSDDLSLTLGANNLLDVYPDEADAAFRSGGRFIYSRRSPQFSYGGRHIFARVNFNLN